MSSEQIITAVVAVVAVLLMAVGGGFAWRAWRLARIVANTPPTPISGLDAGLHEVRGALHGDGLLESPLTRRACLYWRLVLEQRRRNRWETLVDRRDVVPVWLDDGGGRLVLAAAEADVIVTAGSRGTGGIFGYPSAELSELLGRLGSAPEGMVGPYLRYREEVLQAGDRLNAVGTVVSDAEGWEMRAEGDVFVLSDRDEGDVVRAQERAALRWFGLALIGALLGVYAITRVDVAAVFG